MSIPTGPALDPLRAEDAFEIEEPTPAKPAPVPTTAGPASEVSPVVEAEKIAFPEDPYEDVEPKNKYTVDIDPTNDSPVFMVPGMGAVPMRTQEQQTEGVQKYYRDRAENQRKLELIKEVPLPKGGLSVEGVDVEDLSRAREAVGTLEAKNDDHRGRVAQLRADDPAGFAALEAQEAGEKAYIEDFKRRRITPEQRDTLLAKPPEFASEEMQKRFPLRGYYNKLQRDGFSRWESKEIVVRKLISAYGLPPSYYDQVRNLNNPETGEKITLTDDDIIAQLLDVRDPGHIAAFMEGATREGIRSAAAGYAALEGGKWGARAGLAVPIPHPIAKAAAGVAGAVGGVLVGGVGGYLIGDKTQEALLDPVWGDEPLSLDSYVAFEAGRTMGSMLAFISPSHRAAKMIPEKVPFGASQMMNNIYRANAVGPNGPIRAARLRQQMATPFQAVARPIARAGEKIAESVGRVARDNPASFLAAELTAVPTVTLAAGIAESFAPGETGPRVGAEVVAGFFSLNRLFSNVASNAVSIVKRVITASGPEGQKAAAARFLKEAFKAAGEDSSLVLRAMKTGEVTDPDGNVIARFSPGQTTGSKALLALEAQLSSKNATYGSDLVDSAESGLIAVSRLIRTMYDSGDPTMLQTALVMERDLIASSMLEEITSAAAQAAQSSEAVRQLGTSTISDVSAIMRPYLDDAIGHWREMERAAWNQVDNSEVFNVEELLENRAAFVAKEYYAGRPVPDSINRWLKGLFDIQSMDEAAVDAVEASVSALSKQQAGVQQRAATFSAKQTTEARDTFRRETEGAISGEGNFGPSLMSSDELAEETVKLQGIIDRYSAVGDGIVEGTNFKTRDSVRRLATYAMEDVILETQKRALQAERATGIKGATAGMFKGMTTTMKEIRGLRGAMLTQAKEAAAAQNPELQRELLFMADELLNALGIRVAREQRTTSQLLRIKEDFSEFGFTASEARVVTELRAGARDVNQIAEATGLNPATVRRYATSARAKAGSDLLIPSLSAGRPRSEAREAMEVLMREENVMDVAELARRTGVSREQASSMKSRIMAETENLSKPPASASRNPVEELSPNQIALARALEISLLGNDLFTRTFSGTATASARSGANRLSPEIMARTILRGGNEQALLRFEEMQNAISLGLNDAGSPLRQLLRPSELASTDEATLGYNEVMSRILSTLVGQRTIKPARGVTGADNPAKLVDRSGEPIQMVSDSAAKSVRDQYGEILELPAFEALKEALQDGVSATNAFNTILNRNSAVYSQNEGVKLLNKVLSVEDAPLAVGRVVESDMPAAGLRGMLKTINRMDAAAVRPQAREALYGSLLDYAMAKYRKPVGSGSDTILDFQGLREFLFEPMGISRSGPSPMQILMDGGAVESAQAASMRAMLDRMENVSASIRSTSRLADVLNEPSAVFDTAVSIIGAMAGRSLGRSLGSGGTVQIPAAGVSYAKRVFDKMPMASARSLLMEATNPSSASGANQLFTDLMERAIKGQAGDETRNNKRIKDFVWAFFGSPIVIYPNARERVGDVVAPLDQLQDVPMKSELFMEGNQRQEPAAPAPSPAAQPQPQPMSAPAQSAPTPQPALYSPEQSGQRYLQAFGPNDTMSDIAQAQSGGIASL